MHTIDEVRVVSLLISREKAPVPEAQLGGFWFAPSTYVSGVSFWVSSEISGMDKANIVRNPRGESGVN
jgi:hypothetical protein